MLPRTSKLWKLWFVFAKYNRIPFFILHILYLWSMYPKLKCNFLQLYIQTLPLFFVYCENITFWLGNIQKISAYCINTTPNIQTRESSWGGKEHWGNKNMFPKKLYSNSFCIYIFSIKLTFSRLHVKSVSFIGTISFKPIKKAFVCWYSSCI